MTLAENYRYLAVLVGGYAEVNDSDTQYVAVDGIDLFLGGGAVYDMPKSEGTVVVGTLEGAIQEKGYFIDFAKRGATGQPGV